MPSGRRGTLEVIGRAAAGALVALFADLFEDPEDLADTADQQALLVDVDPRAGRGMEDDVVAWGDRHAHADVVPPVQALADREDDPVLGRRLVGAGRDEQPGAAEALRLELLDHHAVEEGAQEVLHPRAAYETRRPARSGAMRSSRAIAVGSVLFFLAGPGLEAGVGPWLLVTVAGGPVDGWPPAARVAGALLMAAGLAVLAD